MLNLSDTFATLGAFIRADASLAMLSEADLLFDDNATHLRTLPKIQGLLQELDQDAASAGRDAATQVGWLGSQTESARLGLQGLCQKWLVSTVGSKLRAVSGVSDAISALADEMRDQSESVAANAITLEAIEPHDANTGGTLLYATILDIDHDGNQSDSQMARDATFVVSCQRDSSSPTIRQGDEQWQVTTSFGADASLRTIPQSHANKRARNALVNGAFAAWDLGLPKEWTTTGVTSLVSQDQTIKAIGESSLKFDGLGEVVMVQEVAERMRGAEALSLGAFVRVDEISAGEVTIRVLLNGTPLTPAIVIDSGIATGAWEHHHAFVPCPRLKSSDLLEVEISTDNSFDGELNLDGLTLASPMDLGGGVKLAAIEGREEAITSDRYLVTTASNEASPFNSYLRDTCEATLPTDASPTIASSLAE